MYIIKFLDENYNHNLGSDNTRYIHLKTLRGVYNRLKSQFIPKNAQYFEIIKVINPMDNNRKEVVIGIDFISQITN